MRPETLAVAVTATVGGALPQIRGESLVFGETEGELMRERDPGCSPESGVSIFFLAFYLLRYGDTKRHGMRVASRCFGCCMQSRGRLHFLLLLLFFFFFFF